MAAGAPEPERLRLPDDTLMPDHPWEKTPLVAIHHLLESLWQYTVNVHQNDNAFTSLLRDLRVRRDDDGNLSSVIMKGPLHWESRHNIVCSQDLNSLVEVSGTLDPDPIIKRLLGKVISFYTGANSLKQLERYNDKRQPSLYLRPSPDGENLLRANLPLGHNFSAELCFEWTFQRLWIRLLHLPGFLAKNQQRYQAFERLYGCARALLDLERARCGKEPVRDGYSLRWSDPTPYFIGDWIEDSRLYILQALEAAAAIAYARDAQDTSRGGNSVAPPNATSAEIFQHNFTQHATRTLTLMVAEFESRMAEHPFERLIIDLLDREDTFERVLTREHVEDKLINKQVAAVDEDYVMRTQHVLTRNDITPESVAHILAGLAEEKDDPENHRHRIGELTMMEENIRITLAAISLTNRQRRNFRLMREWIDHRPWKFMLQQYDTSAPENQWMVAGIEKFNEAYLEEIGTPELYPSQTENVRCNMFGIKPIDGINNPIPENSEPCIVCLAPFTPGNTFDHTIVVLHCKHMFHMKCIFEYWDHPNRYAHSCPKCGLVPQLAHERVGIEPGCNDPVYDSNNTSFTYNIFGWVGDPNHRNPDLNLPQDSQDWMRRSFNDLPFRRPNRGVPPIGNRYWERENAFVQTYEEAPLRWDIESDLERYNPDHWISIVAQWVGNDWRVMKQGQTEGAKFFDASRFTVDVETGYLRHKRRIRDKNRRERVRTAGSGLGGL